jgi:hypothetical protein
MEFPTSEMDPFFLNSKLESIIREHKKKQRKPWGNYGRVLELLFWFCVHICTLLFSESSRGEHGTISGDHHESVVPKVISCVVPK